MRGSAAHVVDSSQQFALTHAAHVLVPYGKPQRVEVRTVGGLSVMPMIWRQERALPIAANATIAATPSAPVRYRTTA
jgi:hypothetical protein